MSFSFAQSTAVWMFAWNGIAVGVVLVPLDGHAQVAGSRCRWRRCHQTSPHGWNFGQSSATPYASGRGARRAGAERGQHDGRGDENGFSPGRIPLASAPGRAS